MNRVIVFGSLNIDLSIACDRMPEMGETLAGYGFIVNPGGKGANQAVAAARLGAPTSLIGAVGTDVFGDQLASTLERDAIETAELVRTDTAPTGTAVIIRSGGDNRILVEAGANHVLRAGDALAALDRIAHPGDVFVTQLECELGATVAALEHARARGLATVFNPAPACPVPDELWQRIDLLCLNETECAAYTDVLPEDDASVAEAMARLRALGVGSAVITRGAAGADVWGPESGADVQHVPARPVDAVDTTAAGDTFIGGLVAARLRGLNLVDAAAWATRASAIAVTRAGAQQSIPTFAEVEAAKL